jgi:DNA-binding NtrC family response regulator
MKANILLVFRHNEARLLVADALSNDYAVINAATGEGALDELRGGDYTVIVTNDILDDMTGEELAASARTIRPEIRVVITSTHENIDNAINVLGHGEFVYVSKPLSAARVRHAVALELDRANLHAENWALKARVDGIDPLGVLIGSSMAIEHVRERIKYVGAASAPVLITGARGTGKQQAADAIHRASDFSQGPMVQVDCTTTPEELLEKEMFGADHGHSVRGKCDYARGGTLMIAGVDHMPAAVQERLMSFLRERGNETRVIATTRKDLKPLVQSGEFREDLLYAINVLSVDMPTLYERRADIPALVVYFIKYSSALNAVPPVTFSADAVERLCNMKWHGNVRELRNVVERAVLMGGGGVVNVSDLQLDAQPTSNIRLPEVEGVFRAGSIREMEKLMILNRLRENDENRTRSAETLEISVRTLRNKLNEYNVGRKRTQDVRRDETDVLMV